MSDHLFQARSKLRACYGVDLDGNELIVVRSERSRGRITHSVVHPTDPGFRDAMQGTTCIGVLSAKESFTRWLEAPFSAAGKALKVFPTLLDVELPFPLEDCLYSFTDLRRTASGKIRALAIVARRKDVEQKIATLNAKSLDPVILDQEGLALWTQGLREVPVQAAESGLLRVVIHLGVAHCSVAVGRGPDFINAHGMLSKDAGQIGRLMRTYQEPDAGQVRWIWTGAGAQDARLIGELQGQLTHDWNGTSATVDAPACFLARALSTRALLSGALSCNLRSGVLTHPAVTRQIAKRHRLAAWTLLAAGIFLCVANLTVIGIISRKNAALDASFRSLGSELGGYDIGEAKGEQGLQKVREKTDKRKDLFEPFLNCFKQPLHRIVTVIADTGKKVDLRYDTLSLTHDKISITGTAGDWKSCDELVKVLSREGYAARLIRKDAKNDERVPFTITSGGTD